MTILLTYIEYCELCPLVVVIKFPSTVLVTELMHIVTIMLIISPVLGELMAVVGFFLHDVGMKPAFPSRVNVPFNFRF